MKRIFSIIAALSAAMVLLAGAGVYWFTAADARDTERTAVSTIANSVATGIIMQIGTLQQTVDGLAQSDEVVSALQSGNKDIINATASKLQGIVPQSLRLRLLLPTTSELDESQAPHMGFGDLDMVRATLTGKPKPVIQGEGEHRHLAITSAVIQNQKVIGVVLVSLKANLPQQIVSKTQFDDGFIELKQDQLVIASLGKPEAKIDDPISMPLTDNRWQIDFWPQTEASMGDISLIGAMTVVPALLACLIFFVGYRKLTADLRHDQNSVLKAAKDMMQGKIVGNYPVQLDEMLPIVATLAQFKRVLDQENPSVDNHKNPEANLFDESFDLDFFDDSAPVSTGQSSAPTIAIPVTPVSMPHTDNWSDELTTTAIAQPVAEPAPEHKSTPLDGIFLNYDIRGIAGNNLTAEIVANIGRAFASEAKQFDVNTIVVARDGRQSSPALTEALIEGIVSTGCNVLDIGLAPTPVLYFVSHHSDGRTGIIVTGSHHPDEYNGLKMLLHGETLTAERLQALKNRIQNSDYHIGTFGSVERNSLFSNEYIGMISEDIHIVRPMTVVVDCGNGAASQLGPMLLRTIGCDVVELCCDTDSPVANHHPDPSNPDNLQALIKAVKLNNADVGIAFDGDGDRLGVVDSNGNIIWPDRQMMLFARDVLAAKPGAEILFDVASSKHLPEQIIKRGGRPMMWKCGQAPMRAKIRETAAALAGTMNGHFFFNHRWFGFDDGLYAAARLIEILSGDMRSSSELFGDLPDSTNTPELHVPMPEGESQRFIEQLINSADLGGGKLVDIDGMRVEFRDGWGLARASDTEHALMLRFEADSPEALQRIQSSFKQWMQQIKADISLPF